MVTIHISEALAERLAKLAEQQNRSLDEVAATILEDHTPDADAEKDSAQESSSQINPLIGMIGLLDEYTDATDLSSTIRETLRKYTHPKYGWTKRDRTD